VALSTDTPVGSRRLRQDARDNRERIITAARQLFAQRGLDAPLDEIARQAGVSIGTVYNRFRRRGDLIDAALIQAVAKSVQLAEDALAASDPWEALVDHLTAIAEMQATDRGFGEICIHTLDPATAVERAKARGHQLVLELMKRAQRAGVLRDDIDMTDLGLMVWAVVSATDGVRDQAPDAWRRHLALLLDGMRATAATPLPGRPLTPGTVTEAMKLSQPPRQP
jgi:AcrR family transcriptional regulator